jgi:hypothetical protein
MAVVRVGGVDLSSVSPDDLKARAFVDVSHEPGIRLVWIGIILAVVGGLLAMLRRWKEARLKDDTPAAPSPVRMPGPPRPVAQPEPGLASLLSRGEVQ